MITNQFELPARMGSVGEPSVDPDLVNSIIQKAAASVAGVPSGSILAYGGTTVPSGYLLCNGTSYLRSDYPGLYTAIGNAYGTVDGTHFNVPDLRGQFLRGVDGGAAIDPDRAGRTALNAGGNTGDNVGSKQLTATKRPVTSFTTGNESADHTHTLTLAATSVGSGGPGFYPLIAGGTSAPTTSGRSAAHTHTITGGGDSETRSLNVYVNYIIKS